MNESRYEPKLTQEEFEQLHQDLAGARKSSKEVKVNKQALERLLQDHSALWVILGAS